MEHLLAAILLAIPFAIAGGWISRMCGGGPPKLPYGLDQWIFAFPYFAACSGTGLWALPAYACAVLGKRQANRVFMDLGTWKDTPRKAHRYETVIGFLKPHLSNYRYDYLGLALTGLAVTIVPGIIYGVFINAGAGLILALSGALKAPAYLVGFVLEAGGHLENAPEHMNEATAIGEFLTGVAAWGIAAFFLFSAFQQL